MTPTKVLALLLLAEKKQDWAVIRRVGAMLAAYALPLDQAAGVIHHLHGKCEACAGELIDPDSIDDDTLHEYFRNSAVIGEA